ncbi:fumarylacetoacetate hydrolase family protein [Aureimonas fodinaquatilis]|uniref:Fumarylacetoacetate hydrolase family protein n=1 Tax=Aureimonas fodinaquatilis TaxID=2565783 RepID=A0A5B0DVX2_9HYPH|nr:fumarylacetoacetate hydrolase family protein [Aureimonas fodinaquatilis]KAA0969329.1 fumarylacetoacetate hydrolase family protein [Aureimonas fodinaquatilis]
MSSEKFVIAPAVPGSLPVNGTEKKFPVRRIYCIGRNFVAHVEEMGGTAETRPPYIFQKPNDSLVPNGASIPYPTMTDDFHYELELVVALKSGGYNISEEDALSHIYGYGIGLDMSRRKVFGEGLDQRPSELLKSFDHSCPCGTLYPVEQVGHIKSGKIQLKVDGEIRQDSDLNLMVWPIPKIISIISKYYSLEAGDIILTGTPHGVGPVVPGNTIVGTIEGLSPLEIHITEPVA